MAKSKFRNDESQIESAFRLDRTTIKGHAVKQDNGFLFSDSVLTRAGIFSYLRNDGTIQRELRPPEEVFSQVSIDSLKMKPVTHNHPTGKKVTPENAKELQVGNVGENLRRDIDDLMGPLLVTDKATIDSIEAGNRDISCGYECDVIQRSGLFNGERFDAVQTNIKYNHVAAAIPKGRAGNAKINLDSDLDSAIAVEIIIDNDDTEGNEMPDLKTIKIDGVDYQAEGPVITELTKRQAKVDAITEELTAANTAKSTIEGERDTLKEANTALKADSEDSEKLNKRVNERMELIGTAQKVLKGDDAKDLGSLPDEDIKKKVILAKSPDAKLDGKDEAYINARYDGALELIEKGTDGIDYSKANNDGFDTHENKNDSDRVDSDKSRAKMREDQENAWKGEEKK